MDYKAIFESWKKALTGTPYQAEIDAIGADEALKEDAFYKDLEFGTAGMRGVIGLGTNRMNIFTVRKATQGLANYINKIGGGDKGVAIAYDSRKYSDVFAKETALVLCNNGIKVYLYDCLHSVPQLSYTILKLGCIAGVVITASHNPKIYNGYKAYGADGGQLAVEDAATVTSYIEAIDDVFAIKGMDEQEALNKGLLQYIGDDVDQMYYKDVLSLVINKDVIDRQKDSLSIVYTPLHGSGNKPVRHVLGALGIQKLAVVKEQEMPDPEFSTVSAPNPEQPDAFRLAIPLAEKVGATMILGTDPDCDRLGVVVKDNAGEFKVLTGNQIGCLLMDYVLSQKQSTFTGDEFVVKSIVSSPMADVIAAHYGVELRAVLTGFKFIAEQIKLSQQTGKGKFLFGFEESYGFLSGTFVRDKDACIASMLVSEMTCYYADKGMTLYQALEALYAKYGYFKEKVISKTLSGIEGIAKIGKAVETVREEAPKEVGGYAVKAVRDYQLQKRTDLATGQVTAIGLPKSNVLFFELDNASFILRPSGTEPKLKAYVAAAAPTDEAAQAKFDQLLTAVSNLMDELTR
ncbi:MAG: phospho-sugar mutase [Eubacteriales bacterium]|jgi:phosphoglucomutase